ncbi:MAG: lysyl oxidase family protein, partial [Planctomycetota bacterium]
GLIPEPGLRRLLRFSTHILNMGERDAIIGDPEDPEPGIDPDAIHLSPCHGHFHLDGYAEYELWDDAGEIVGFGHEQAFCLLDSQRVVADAPSSGYDCSFQGISSGWKDIYGSGLDGQWVDVTGIPAGTYTLKVTVNPFRVIPEVNDLRDNSACVTVTLPDPDQPLP